jgi:hypothetical protein
MQPNGAALLAGSPDVAHRHSRRVPGIWGTFLLEMPLMGRSACGPCACAKTGYFAGSLLVVCVSS